MDKKEALKQIKKSGHELVYLPDEFKKDKEIVLEAVKTYGRALEFADDSLKNDPDILEIVNKDK
jgi:hypothetical protein